MKRTVDYSKSPAKASDAVNDVREWLGDKYDKIAADMRRVTNPRQFSFFCMLAGIEGYPVEAWYEHFQGAGSWDKAHEGLPADDVSA